jgi:hypothetical protein
MYEDLQDQVAVINGALLCMDGGDPARTNSPRFN